MDATYGWWTNFRQFEFTRPDGRDGPLIVPGRWNFEGRLKVPETPFSVGFDANVGKGPDDVRIVLGFTADFSSLLKRLGAVFE